MREWVVIGVLFVCGCADSADVPVDEAADDDDDFWAVDDDDAVDEPGVDSAVFQCATTPEGRPAFAREGDYLARDHEVSGTRPWCQGVRHAVAGAAGSTLRVQLTAWVSPSPAIVEVRDLLDGTVATLEGAAAGDTLSFPLDRSGEYLVLLEPMDATADANDYTLGVTCEDGCDLLYTRHPIVLMHGMGGTDSFFDLLDYFWGVPGELTGLGYDVHYFAVEPYDPIASRAAEWVILLDDLVAEGQGRRFNLIGHSQGGLDARYLIWEHGYADRVASLTTISSPHHGTPMADVVTGAVDISPLDGEILDAALTALSLLMGMGEQEAAEAMADISTEGMAEFNDLYPDHPDVPYYSWAGHSCGILEPLCILDYNGEVVNVLLGPTYTLIWAFGYANDGMVPVESAQWGQFLGELPADHMDEVGQIADVINLSFDHLEFYRSEAARLAAAGY
jgi:triacylglycerol esterase/lipase EstA (alpha/beta hydrolase family)